MNNKYDIIKNFPDIKLSYDNNLHRKVYCDIYLSIPKGTKSFLWFTYENKNNVCYLLQLNKYNQIDMLNNMLCVLMIVYRIIQSYMELILY